MYNFQIEKVRVYVDITVDSWMCLTDKLTAAAKMSKTDLLLHQVVN